MNRFTLHSLALAAIFSVVVAPSASIAQDGELTKFDADEAFAAGKVLFEEGKFNDALAKLNVTLQIDKTNWEALQYKALALNEIEAYDSSVQVFKDALDINPNSPIARNGRGEAYLELGQFDLARADFDAAGDLDRNNPRILSNIGHMKVNFFGDFTGGLRFLEDAIAMNPEDARAHRDKGLAHAQLNEHDEAMAALESAAELEPGNYENYSAMAAILLRQEDYDGAINAYSKAIETYEPEKRTDPATFVEGYLRRAQARLVLGSETIDSDPAKSQSAYEAVITDAKSVLAEYEDRYPELAGTAHYQKGLAQRMLGRYGESIESLTEAIQITSGAGVNYLADAYIRRGICWHNQGYGALARKDFERAISIDFESPLPHFWIGLSYAAEEDYREAINHYSNAVDQRDDFALAFVNRGLAYYKLGEFEKAIDNFNEAISFEPLEPEHYYKRGMSHVRLEQYDQAATSFADALRKAPDMAKAKAGMKRAQDALGNTNLSPLYDQ
ncbi:tetratricopeptide repeat protein [Pirellulales bacterium]|nr:tetratricopeptide repeat protein [Pirellulales bacterium]